MTDMINRAALAKLSGLAETIALRRDCTLLEAVAHIEQVVTAPPERGAPRLRPLGDFADRIRKVRVDRNERLGVPVFRDPSWDMLLDLVVAREEGRDVSVRQLCGGSGAPHTTALRHLERLRRYGFIAQEQDGTDRRRAFVRLGPDMAPKLEAIIRAFQSCAGTS